MLDHAPDVAGCAASRLTNARQALSRALAGAGVSEARSRGGFPTCRSLRWKPGESRATSDVASGFVEVGPGPPLELQAQQRPYANPIERIVETLGTVISFLPLRHKDPKPHACSGGGRRGCDAQFASRCYQRTIRKEHRWKMQTTCYEQCTKYGRDTRGQGDSLR